MQQCWSSADLMRPKPRAALPPWPPRSSLQPQERAGAVWAWELSASPSHPDQRFTLSTCSHASDSGSFFHLLLAAAQRTDFFFPVGFMILKEAITPTPTPCIVTLQKKKTVPLILNKVGNGQGPHWHLQPSRRHWELSCAAKQLVHGRNRGKDTCWELLILVGGHRTSVPHQKCRNYSLWREKLHEALSSYLS